MLTQLGLVCRTVPYLRWKQLLYRPLRWLQFRSYRTVPRLAKRWTNLDQPIAEIPSDRLAQFRSSFENYFFHWKDTPEAIADRVDLLKQGKFRFLNQVDRLCTPNWNKRHVSHLWNYQLHYQDYIVWLVLAWSTNKDDVAWQKAKVLIESWITTANIGVSDGWDAYPVSLRTVNWIYAYALAAENEGDKLFLARWRTSIFRQLDFLNHHQEKHLLANHLFKNIKSLVIGGLFFAHTAEGQRWLATGERWLKRELCEQVLEDGGHYERTPMYHAQTLSDLLECYVLLNACGSESFGKGRNEKLVKMAQFLASMSYSDGTLSLFNDSANNFETRPLPYLQAIKKLFDEDLSGTTVNFYNSGYFVWQSADAREKIIIDAGEPSVSYNTAHAHCDMLSYELRMNGAPFVVDSGVHGYGGDAFREYCRSTRAHNTVMLDEREQSEVWGTFRVASRAQVKRAEAVEDADGWCFDGEVKGYDARGLRHSRSVRRLVNGEWEVTDKLVIVVDDTREHVAHSFIHLHPSVKIRKQENYFLCETQAGEILIEPFGELELSLVKGIQEPQMQGWYFPEFGIALPSPTIIMRCVFRSSNNSQVIGYRIKPISLN